MSGDPFSGGTAGWQQDPDVEGRERQRRLVVRPDDAFAQSEMRRQHMIARKTTAAHDPAQNRKQRRAADARARRTK